MYLMVFLWITCIVAQRTVKSSPAPTHLLLRRVGPCNDEPHTIVSVSELSITPDVYDSSLSGTLNISENISDGWKIKVTMEKCLDLRNIDTCDHFKSFFMVNNGCNDEDEQEQDIYGMFFHYATPKLECPLQAGTYKITDYPFFTEDNYLTVYEAKLSTSVFGYIYRIHGFSKRRRKILCMEAYLQLLYVRKHEWGGNTNTKENTRTTTAATTTIASSIENDFDD